MPPVAWHGRFATSPLAEPDFAATPSPVATPLARTHAPPQPIEDPVDTPPVVGALALDMYTMPVPQTDEHDVEAVTPPAAPAVAPVPEPPEPMTPPEAMVYTPPVATTTTAARPVVAHEELDPEVRALVDDLYDRARAELAGGDFMMFSALEPDPIEQEYEPFPALDEYERSELPELPELRELPALEIADVQPVVETPPAPAVDAPPPVRPRTGWVPAFVADERRRRHVSD
jgi:hypothetical protein